MIIYIMFLTLLCSMLLDRYTYYKDKCKNMEKEIDCLIFDNNNLRKELHECLNVQKKS